MQIAGIGLCLQDAVPLNLECDAEIANHTQVLRPKIKLKLSDRTTHLATQIHVQSFHPSLAIFVKLLRSSWLISSTFIST